jgi:hypothetical protein
MITFEIVQGSLKLSSGGIVILLIPKKDVSIIALSLEETPKKVELFNLNQGYTFVVFSKPLSQCQDVLSIPFTESTFLTFAEDNLGF